MAGIGEEVRKVLAETDQWATATKHRTVYSFDGCSGEMISKTTLSQYWEEERVERVSLKEDVISAVRGDVILRAYAEDSFLEARVGTTTPDRVQWVCECMKTRVNLQFICEITGSSRMAF